MTLLQKKISFTLFVILLFIIGNRIPLPIAGFENNSIPSDFTICLFTLGITPWMSAQILVRILYLGKKQSMSSKRNMLTYFLTIIIGIIQSMGMLLVDSSWEYLIYSLIPSVVILIAGSFILIFIAQCNTEYGLGGQSVMFLLNIFLSRTSQLSDLPAPTTENILIGLIILSWSLLSIYTMVILDKAEYRIPVNRVSINSTKIKDNYVPLKLNPSGGMALMYGFSIISLSNYIIMFFSKLFSNEDILATLSPLTDLTNWKGGLYYVIILFMMTILFTFFNFDIEEFSDNLQKSGDYLIDIRPGLDTKKYLKNILLSLGIFSGFQICLLAGIPLFLGYFLHLSQDVVSIPGIFLMTSGMILMMNQEIVTIKMVKEYEPLL